MRVTIALLLLAATCSSAAAQVVATPRWIDKCEQALADFVMRPSDRPYAEIEARALAVTLYQCDERRLLDRATKLFIAESAIGPYFDAYAENPNVWREDQD